MRLKVKVLRKELYDNKGEVYFSCQDVMILKLYIKQNQSFEVRGYCKEPIGRPRCLRLYFLRTLDWQNLTKQIGIKLIYPGFKGWAPVFFKTDVNIVPLGPFCSETTRFLLIFSFYPIQWYWLVIDFCWTSSCSEVLINKEGIQDLWDNLRSLGNNCRTLMEMAAGLFVSQAFWL